MALTAVQDGLTARRKQRTWEQIVSIAADLFLAQGFHETTIEEIALVAEVSPRTIHRYFPTKEDLFLAHTRTGWDAFLAQLSSRPGREAPLVAVKAAVRAAFAEGWSDGPRVQAFLAVAQGTPSLQARWGVQGHDLQARLAEVLAARAGRRRPGLDDHVTAGAISSTISAALREWAGAGVERSLPAVVDRALSALARPLLPA